MLTLDCTMVAEPETSAQPIEQPSSSTTVITDERPLEAQPSSTERIYGAFRNGQLVNVAWHELTDGERRDAYCNLFAIYEVL